MPFCLARRICTKTVKNSPKLPSKIIDAGIEKGSEKPVEVLRAEKNLSETSILRFVSAVNPNNSNIFVIIKIIKNTIENPRWSAL